jgi:hypothetical protein
MKVEFKDSFFESLEKMVWYDTKLWKAWDAIRYDIPNFFKNIYRFRKELYSHQWWDYRFTLEMLYRSLTILEKGLSKDGMEVPESREKKLKQIRRVLELLKHKLDDDYIERAEKVLGQLPLKPLEWEEIEGTDSHRLIDNDTPAERKHMKKVFARARKVEKAEWVEMWSIISGLQTDEHWKDYIKTEDYTKLNTEGKFEAQWKWSDGSDMRTWWD